MGFFVITPEFAKDIKFRDREPLDYVSDVAMTGAPVLGIHAGIQNLRGKMPDKVYDKRFRYATGALLLGQLLRTYLDVKHNPHQPSFEELQTPFKERLWKHLKESAFAAFNDQSPEDAKARLSKTVKPVDIVLYDKYKKFTSR